VLAAVQCIVIGPVCGWVCFVCVVGKKKKVKEADLYSAFIEVTYTQGAQMSGSVTRIT